MKLHPAGASGLRRNTIGTAIVRPRRASFEASRRWHIVPVVLVVLAGVVLPMSVIAIGSLSSPQEWGGIRWGSFSTEAYVRLLYDQDLDGTWMLNVGYAAIVLRTLVLSGIATVGCLALGFPAALYVAMQPARHRTRLLLIITVPFWTSLVVRLYAWILLLRSGGVLTSVSDGLFGIGVPSILYTDAATVIGLVYAFIPFMVLPIFTSLEHMNWDTVDAAADLGATPWTVITNVIVPAAKRGIVSGCALVFVPSLGAYLIPDMLGGAKSMMLGNLINLQFGDAHNWPVGAALSIAMCAFVLVGVLIKHLIVRGCAGENHA
ncbi:ABC transporter permease [Burkholderia mayonis]|uniref:ABC transporter permease n=1 Tax=Burkholderia mayonis TaxID=1385591 RepID=UPI0009E6A087|nr:ABC transporter permease [Burkholderia mayonis]